MLHIFRNGYTCVFPRVFRHMFQAFQLFWTYVANVFSRCCKSRSGVAHVVMDLICSSRLAAAAGHACMRVVWMGREQQVQETIRAQIESVGYRVVTDTERAPDTKWRGTPREASIHARRRTLTLPNSGARLFLQRSCLDKNFLQTTIVTNLAAHAWSIKYRRKKLIVQFGWKSRDERA
jgi:hypothetical protein